MIIAICYDLPQMTEIPPDIYDMLDQVKFVESCLTDIGHTVKIIPYRGRSQEFIQALHEARPEVVWNLFETYNGSEEKGYMGAMLLESSGIPFTGSSVQSLMFCTDKTIVNSILAEAGINVPFQYIPGTTENLGYNMTKFGVDEWIIKPAKLHGSVGITDHSVFYSAKEGPVIEALKKTKPELEMFAEQYIDGREFAVSLLDRGWGLVPIAVAEMKFINYDKNKPKILNYDSKWNEKSEDYKKTKRTFNHAHEDRFIIEEMTEIAAKVSAILGLSGFARVDFRYDVRNKPWVIDVNPNPGLGEDSGFIAACRRVALPPEKAIDAIAFAARKTATR